MPVELAPPVTVDGLSVSVETVGSGWAVTVKFAVLLTPPYAPLMPTSVVVPTVDVVTVNDAELADNWFHLSPGEERTVPLLCTAYPHGGTVRALNGYGIEPILADRGVR